MAKSISLTFEDIVHSKTYVPQSEMFTFKHPVDYLEPVLNSLHGTNFKVSYKAEMGVKNINTDSSTNVSYGRIAMLATNNDFNLQVSDPFFNRLSHQTGMVFSLDTQKPEIKCFSGYNVDVCTNMCVFGNANVLTLQLKDGLDKSYSQMKEFFSVAEETMTNHQNVINTLTNNYYSYKDLEAFIGKALFYATANSHLGTTPVLKAVKLLSDKSSKYALDHKQGGTGWLIYNAFTEALKDSSVSDEPTKVALLENLFLS